MTPVMLVGSKNRSGNGYKGNGNCLFGNQLSVVVGRCKVLSKSFMLKLIQNGCLKCQIKPPNVHLKGLGAADTVS